MGVVQFPLPMIIRRVILKKLLGWGSPILAKQPNVKKSLRVVWFALLYWDPRKKNMIGLKIGKQIHHNICRCAVWFLLWIQAASNHGLFVSVWWGPWPSWHHSSRERKSWRPQYRCPGSSPNASNRGTWRNRFHVLGIILSSLRKLKRSLASNALPVGGFSMTHLWDSTFNCQVARSHQWLQTRRRTHHESRSRAIWSLNRNQIDMFVGVCWLCWLV